ncbi:MAG: nuclear transport factor 2 family protein [Actinomycetota bacterium]
MTDHEAIARVVARYCHLLDDGRWDEFADLWATDAELVLRGEVVRGRDAIRRTIEETQPPERRGRHLAVNLEVDVTGDRATGLCDFMFWARNREGAPVLRFLGRYADALARADGVWRFTRREIEFF